MASDSLAGVPLAWPEQPGELPRSFASRQALEAELQQLFPEAPGALSPIRGGRHQALTAGHRHLPGGAARPNPDREGRGDD